MTMKELRKHLEVKSLDELVDMIYNQGLKIDEIRGYANGMQKFMYKELGKETIIDCYIANFKTFGVFD